MPPPMHDAQRREVDRVEARRVQQPVEQRVDACHEREPRLAQQRDEALHVARIGDQQVMAAELHEAEQVRRQRVDVVERQRRHDDACVAAVKNGRAHAAACSVFAIMLRCVSIAPLARPVVPPVYCRNARSRPVEPRRRIGERTRRARARRDRRRRPAMCHGRTSLFTCLTTKFTMARLSGEQ